MADLQNLLRQAVTQLQHAQVPSARTDAELLAGHVLGLSRSQLQLKAVTGMEVSDDDAERLAELLTERARRIPLQHLTGTAPFRRLELKVGPGAFIPRPETETVVQAALDELIRLESAGVRRPRVVDLGTGSGAIAAAIASEHPSAEVHAVELSAEAASWAELNFADLPSGSAEVTLHREDLRNFPDGWEAEFDVVVSNPPYIPADMVPQEEEVRVHDPELALYGGGSDGLELPRAVIIAAQRLLVPGGWFIMEHAEVQAPALQQICRAQPQLSQVTTHQDLTGRDRATSARFAVSSEPESASRNG